jgi:rhamnulokinase
VAAVPTETDQFAYASVGTWSLIGTELRAPVLTDRAFRSGFTNEVGVFGTNRLLKNLCGFWLLEDCRRTWAKTEREFSWAELVTLAEAAPAWSRVVDVEAQEFAQPGDMPARLRDFCRRTEQPLPDGVGAMVRLILESLALKYRQTLSALVAITGTRPSTLHLVGGGSKNRLFCRLVADATGYELLAGPAEATAIGNLLMQAVALGRLKSLTEVRELVRRSFPPVSYQPSPEGAIDDLYRRLLDLGPPAPEPSA